VKYIPFLSLEAQHSLIKKSVTETITRIYDGNWFVMGNSLKKFEEDYASYVGAHYCIGTGSGLDALTFALLSCNLKPEDEVIVPAHTFLATWLAVSKAGARIVPVDADPVNFNIDIAQIKSAITARTRVVVPVHMYGQPCDMTAIQELAQQYALLIVEDNAQAHGASWLERKTGGIGVVNATSFYPTKNLGALGDGGAVTTSAEEKAAFVRTARNYGLREKDLAVQLGCNSRLDELQAGILAVKLNHLDEWNAERRKLATLYLQSLQGVGDLLLPLSSKEAVHVYHLFVIRTAYRDPLRKHLQQNGIDTMVHYPIPPHLQPAYQHLNYKQGDFPATETISETALSLPLWPGLSPEDVGYICDTIVTFFDKR
jgi:dTDP-4-amino-4,6-dideoxygalactose transaminase